MRRAGRGLAARPGRPARVLFNSFAFILAFLPVVCLGLVVARRPVPRAAAAG